MAFRSDLDATRERAEAAEKKLEEQADRIARIAETEAQLSNALARLRDHEVGGATWRTRALVWTLAGAVASGGATYFWAEARIGAVREVAAIEASRLAGERAAEERRVEAAEAELRSTVVERDDANGRASRIESELSAIVGMASPEGRLPLGWVTDVEGFDVPVDSRCDVAVPSSDSGCSADLLCRDLVLHRLGCEVVPTTVLETGAGGALRVHRSVSGGSVWIGRSPVGHPVAVPPVPRPPPVGFTGPIIDHFGR